MVFIKGGYTGKILVLNLNSWTNEVEKTDESDTQNFIGAKGLGAKILIDRLPAGTDPLSPENILMFTTGPLTGTRAQTSGRGTVVTKSPSTGLFLDSHFGGVFAAEMKKAGWDIILVKGKSKKPVFINIIDNEVEFNDAEDLLSMECLQTHNFLQKKYGRVKTAVIGPAGEKLVKFSAITIDGHRHAGRGGTGAVMGSKNLKAITVKGNKKIELYDKDGFNNKASSVLKSIQENNFVPIRRKYGTPHWVKVVNDEGFIPTRNFQEGFFEHGDNINAETMQNSIVDKSGACYNCVIACWNRSSIKKGPFKGVKLVGPEYETLALMGSNLGMESIEDVAFLNSRCNELGMDTISLGVVLSFTIECYNKKIITSSDLGGYSIGWGDTVNLSRLIEDIALRNTKIADILAEGVKKAAEKIGRKSISYSVHVKGLEVPGYDPRGVFGMGLAYATSDRGACHQRAWTAKAELSDPELERFSFDKKAELIKNIQDDRAAFFSLVLCDFAPISEQDCVDLWNLSTGFKHDIKSYLKCGERIWNLIRLFNLREGLKPSDDILPERFFKDIFTEGPAKNVVIPRKEFEESLQQYYRLRGWDKKGVPKLNKLKELGLTKYAERIK